MPDLGLIAAVAHVAAAGVTPADATAGDPAAFHAFLDESQAPAVRPFAATFAETSLLANASYEIDTHVRWHNLAQICQEHGYAWGPDLIIYIESAGIECSVLPANCMSRLSDLGSDIV